VRGDFPSGWRSSRRGQTSDRALEAATAKVGSCQPFLDFERSSKQNPRAKSPNFDHAASNVTNTVSIYRSTQQAVAAMRTLSDPRIQDCYQRVYSSVTEQQLGQRSKYADQIASVETSIAPVTDVRIGDESVAYQGAIDVHFKDGSTQTIGVGIASARVDDAVVGYSWTSNTDISATLQPAIVKSVNRLQRAQSAR